MQALRVFLLLLALPLALNAIVLTNDDVIRLVTEDGFLPETVVAYIESQETDFDLTPNELVRLREAGVPEEVLKAMFAAPRAGTAPLPEQAQASATAQSPANPAQAPAPAAAPAPSAQPQLAPEPEPEPVSLEEVIPPPADIRVGRTYFTRFNLKYERSRWPVTNYWRGTLLPINSRVTIVSMNERDMVLRLEDKGSELTIRNVPDYTGGDVRHFAKKMLAGEPTRYELFEDSLAEAIGSGTLRKGMSKEQVVMTRGLPPMHRTPSLDNDTWIFWNSRFGTHSLVFRNDVLAEGRGIH